MALQHSAPIYPMAVSVWIPNEVEGQILGGIQAHVDATQDACLPLRAHSDRHGLGWLVRQEGELRYLRAVYTRPRDRIGTLYPDCLVAVGVEVEYNDAYDLTRIGTPPLLVIEIISKKTRRKDVGAKVIAYAQMGIREYVTFDPRPRKKLELRGYRLVGPGVYGPIAPEPDGGLWLASVGLHAQGEWGAEGQGRLRFTTRTGERLLHVEEEAAARLEAERARLEAERARLEAERGWRQAEATAEEERQRRREAEEHVARLQALLDRHGIGTDGGV
jgi:hypothetical protein